MKIFRSVRSIVEFIKPQKIGAIDTETDDVNQILSYCKHNRCKLVLSSSSSTISSFKFDEETKRHITLISDTSIDKWDDLIDAQIIFINCKDLENKIFNELTVLESLSRDFPIIFFYNYKSTYPVQGLEGKNKESLPLKMDKFLKKINSDLNFTEIPMSNGLSVIYNNKIQDNNNEFKGILNKIISINELKVQDESIKDSLKTNINTKLKSQTIFQKNKDLFSTSRRNIPIYISRVPYLYMLFKSNKDIKSLWGNIRGYRAIKRLKLFDDDYYLNEYKDVLNSGMDPMMHYLYFGHKEGKNPNPHFDGKRYLSQYFDVEMANINPLVHYTLWGTKENRKSEMVVSVVVLTKNHEKHVKKCLNNILIQTGSFRLEIIIGNASQDKSIEILREYQKNYPEIIKIINHEEDIGTYQNLRKCLEHVTGDYVAICEGDNYWTDPYKLEKMSKFLEQNNECVMVFHQTINDNNGIKENYPGAKFHDGIYTTHDIARENFIGNLSCCVYRTNIVKTLPNKLFDGVVDDWIFNIACSEYGDIGYIKNSMNTSVSKEELGLKNSFNLNYETSDQVCSTNKTFSPDYDADIEIQGQYGAHYKISETLKSIFVDNSLKKTLKGKNKTLFLINDSSCELRQHFDEYYSNIFNPEAFRTYYNKKAQFCKERNIKYHFFIVPDKSLVCKDLLPFEVGLVKRNIDHVNDLVPDFIDDLDETCYFKNDSHINYYGAKKLVYRYINTLDKHFTEDDLDKLINEQITTINLVKNGDLLSEINWSYSTEEKEDYIHDKTVVFKNYNLKDIKDNLPEEFKFNGKRETEYLENTFLDSGLKLMVLRDSSMNILKDLLSTNFKEIMLCWDHWDFNKDLVEWYKPDVILEIRTERFLEHMERFL